MNIVKLSEVTADEQRAEEFLREIGILRSFAECPCCGNKHFGKVRRNFYKCYRCKREWSIRKGSVLEKKVRCPHFLDTSIVREVAIATP